MKKRILFITLIGMSIGINAQNTFPSNGSVGIGTSTPSIWFNSHVVEIQNNRPVLKLNSTGTIGTLVFTNALVNSNHYGEFHLNHSYSSSNPSKSRFRFGSYPGGDILTLQADGNIGIGTTSPSNKLHVEGSSGIKVSGVGINQIFIEGVRTGSGTNFRLYDNNNNIYYDSRTNMTFRANQLGGNGGSINLMGGNVGVGTFSPGSWKLAVNGKIRAKEIKVETEWSDFVFEKEYDLPTLSEVENYIKEKGHLKDIPSAKEVEKNGIFLGEMDSKLLQKIEELTLYAIAQEKRLNSTESKNEKLEKEIKELKSMNSKLLELQSRLEKLEKK